MAPMARPSMPSPPATRAAPRATACLGWASSATGRPKAEPTICATSGMRDEPPTSSTRSISAGSTPAEATARRRLAMLSSSEGRIIPSSSDRVSRTSVFSPGSTTGIDTWVSEDSASLASMHSLRSRVIDRRVTGSSSSSASMAP